ncbi:MAG: methyltransferase domain-containing protein [Gammaproteobacteria bacterium]|nr:methyltransferase domain-containing protein [Gammaproteobacteria bacterium]
MQEERLVELLVDLHSGLPRLGPGSKESTLKALAMCDCLPDNPDVLDIGCGCGAQTLVLATATQGQIIATDLFPEFLAPLESNIREKGLDGHVRIEKADMNTLPFPEKNFDLIWSEGAIYIMGFDNGLTNWRRLLRPGGYLVISEVVWFRRDPPAELKTFWESNYPAIRSIVENIESAKALGWSLVGNFHLPDKAWSQQYYLPLQKRIPDFRLENADDVDAQSVADMTEYEISLWERFHEYYGYEFFILRRPEFTP